MVNKISCDQVFFSFWRKSRRSHPASFRRISRVRALPVDGEEGEGGGEGEGEGEEEEEEEEEGVFFCKIRGGKSLS